MQEIGQQNEKQDDLLDKSGFLKRARLFQSKYRRDILNVPCDIFGNYLKDDDGIAGKNFYDGFDIIKAVITHRKKYNKQLYSNMLRSEHIPFNFFVPFRENTDFCKNVFNEILGGCIKTIENKAVIDGKENIKIEFAPKPQQNYLDDGTSFDAYIEYTHIDNSRGIIGIEVKYTERAYTLKKNSKEKLFVEKFKNESEDSKYYSVTQKCNIYNLNKKDLLVSNNFRQIWRNQILGESILQKDKDKFGHFTSVTFFPKDNSHFVEQSEKYIELLQHNENHFKPVTFEDFFDSCKKHLPNDKYKKWLNYLIERYIVK